MVCSKALGGQFELLICLILIKKILYIIIFLGCSLGHLIATSPVYPETFVACHSPSLCLPKTSTLLSTPERKHNEHNASPIYNSRRLTLHRK